MHRLIIRTLFSDWLPKALSFLILIFIARDLGAAKFALYALALGWISYAWAAVDLGQAGYSIRTLAGRPAKEEARLGSEIFSLYLTLAVVVTSALVLLLLVTGVYRSDTGRLVLAMTPFLVVYALFPDWWLRASGRLDQLAFANWAYVGFWLVLLVALPNTALNFALAYAAAPLAGAVVAWLALGRRGTRPRYFVAWTAWVGHLKSSALFAAAGGATQLAIPLTLAGMGTAANPTATGAFAVGLRISLSATNALWLLLQNTLPRLLRFGERLSQPRNFAVMVLSGLFGLAVTGLLWKPVLAPILGGSFASAVGFVLLGVSALIVLGPRSLVEIDLLAGYADVTRILVNSVSPFIVGILLVTGFAARSPAVAPITWMLAELAGVGLGYLALRRRTRLESAEPVAPDGVSAAPVSDTA